MDTDNRCAPRGKTDVPPDGRIDQTTLRRVLGGAFNAPAELTAVTNTTGQNTAQLRSYDVGFRVVRTIRPIRPQPASN